MQALTEMVPVTFIRGCSVGRDGKWNTHDAQDEATATVLIGSIVKPGES